MKKKEQKAASEGDARERLLRAALKLFTQSGYAATSVRELVEEAGVTKPVLYYYFKNKEGIYSEIVKTHFTSIDALFDYYLKCPGSVSERLTSLFDRILVFVIENTDFVRLMHAIYYGPPQGAPYFDFETFCHDVHGFIAAMIEEGVRSGEFRRHNASDTAWIIFGVIHTSIDEHIAHRGPMIDREDSRRILNLVLDEVARKKKK
jgi:TetR/AcrR family transcriptional regulator